MYSQTSDDEELREADDGHDDEDEGSIVLDLDTDLERQRGDGKENDEDDENKKVDDDEDRRNPQYIPKRGVFYEHDDRTADEPYV